MDGPDTNFVSLIELEQRHEKLLRQLDDLDRRVQAVLAECLAQRQPIAGDISPFAGQASPTC
jgi:hypothetical protein